MGLRTTRLESEPQPGDHVFVHRGGYTHHGVALGEGRFAHKVAGAENGLLGVTLSSSDALIKTASGGVELTDLAGFCPEAVQDGAPPNWRLLRVVAYAPGDCFCPSETLALAEQAAAARPGSDHRVYRLLQANCEHFSSWCKTGTGASLQVRAVVGFVNRFGALAAGLLAGTAALASSSRLERTTTRVETKRGRGLRGVLGLGRKKTVIIETSVDENQAIAGGALFGVAAASAWALASSLQRSARVNRRHSFSVRLPDGHVAVVVVPWSVVRRGAEALLAFLRAALEVAAGESVELRLVTEDGATAALVLGESGRLLLPRVASLALCSA
jgi:hypothetical protein